MNEKNFINCKNQVSGLLTPFERLYELGFKPQIQKLYPKVEFPVSRGTPMISPSIKWNHSRKWFVTHYECEGEVRIDGKQFGITLENPEYTYIEGHTIDGSVLFPATGYLLLVWETLAHILHGLAFDNMNIVFENCKFKRACSVPKEGPKMYLDVTIQRNSGNFEVLEGSTSKM